MPKNNAAKFAFYYMLSLVALIFSAISTGIIVFQIINKNIADAIFPYSFDPGALKFAISAMIIAAPIFYLTSWQINKNLESGELDRESSVRKWLVYFILFASSLVMLGWLVSLIYSFLDGELSWRFILKTLTAIVIAAIIFSYYFYDIKREKVAGVKSLWVKIYFSGSVLIILASMVGAFLFVESPRETRNRKFDDAVVQNMEMIDSAINSYYFDNKKMPVSLDLLSTDIRYYLTKRNITDAASNNEYDYKIIASDTYEICATFKSNNKDVADMNNYGYYPNERWLHTVGYQCLQQKVRAGDNAGLDAPAAISAPVRR